MTAAVAIPAHRGAFLRDAWDAADRMHAARVAAAEDARARRVMLAGCLAEIERRRALATELGDLLGRVLAELDELAEAAEVIAIALAMAEDRTR